MKVHKVILLILDTDEVNEEIKDVIENTRYPNRCINPHVVNIESVEIGEFDAEWTNYLLGGVVILTGFHTIMAFLYYYNDPDVARRRRKAQAYGKMKDQELNVAVANQLLKDGEGILGNIAKLEEQYSPEEVAKILAILQGKSPNE